MSDFLEIRVRSTTDCTMLAGSIAAAWNEGKQVSLSCIGPVPISQAFKAVSVANRYLAVHGIVLSIIPFMVTRNILDKESQKEIPWVVSVLKLKDIMK